MIWIDQLKQVGAAYEDGKKVMEFPVLTGDDETTTDPVIYLVRVKDADYYSRKYQPLMPYSIFSIIKREQRFTEEKYRRRRRK